MFFNWTECGLIATFSQNLGLNENKLQGKKGGLAPKIKKEEVGLGWSFISDTINVMSDAISDKSIKSEDYISDRDTDLLVQKEISIYEAPLSGRKRKCDGVYCRCYLKSNRQEWEPDDCNQFVEKAYKIYNFPNMIEQSFVSEGWKIVRKNTRPGRGLAWWTS